MHELSLAENLREIIEEEARRQGFSRVRRVQLSIGELSCVTSDAMCFCFNEVMRGSVAEGAKLEIRKVEGKGRCNRCNHTMLMEALYQLCPKCHAPLDVLQGMEIRLDELFVVDE